jgi:hypothetical protein
MSEEPNVPPSPPVPPAQPITPGFDVVQVENGTWTMFARGESPWFVTGFESPQNAHGWVVDYLTTNIENSNRIHVETLEHKAEMELQYKHALTESLMYSEAASKERKKH